MKSEKKLFLLDAMALVYRAYFAFSNNHRVNSKGLNTSAIFGFVNTLFDLLRKEQPTHIAVVFDTKAPTVRHIEFEAYKAHREEMPEDLSKAIPYIYQLIECFNIPCIGVDGYEADDVIGTLAKKAEANGFTTYMMTPDKDYGQLVSEHIFIYKPARLGLGAEVLGVNEILKKWDIKRIDQLIDILGLMGDKVDNIPGIPGVGEKTAVQLIKDFDSIENLIQHTEQLKGKLKEKVEQNKEKALQSKWLATIICDVPIEFDAESLRRKAPNTDKLQALFSELEFRNMGKQIAETSPKNTGIHNQPASVPTNTPDLFSQLDLFTPVDSLPSNKIHYLESQLTRSELLQAIRAQGSFAFHFHTATADVYTTDVKGIAFTCQVGKPHYLALPASKEQARAIMAEFKIIFEDPAIAKIGYNLKFEMSILRAYQIELRGELFDTMLAHFLVKPEMRHSWAGLAEAYLNYHPSPNATAVEVAAEATDITLQLKEKLKPLLLETQTLQLFEEVEMPLSQVLADMEFEGIRVDTGVLKQLSTELQKDISSCDHEIQQLAGTPFNTSSPKQVGEILFQVLNIVEKPKKTKTGQYATGEEVLIKLVNKHPIVSKILDYRELVKLKNTYVDTLPGLVQATSQRIHTTFNQVVAVTGRLSSDNPNLQNIPIRTLRGKEIRKAFVPRSADYLLLSADYSQIELRIIAELSQDPAMLEAFKMGQDIHAATAARVYGIAQPEVTSEMRRNAKMVNFGIIYGISAFGLSERLNCSRTEAAQIISNYFDKYPGVKAYMDKCISNAKTKGYVETIIGRRRYLTDINSSNATVRGFAERNAINAPIQGTAADMIKIAMIKIHGALKQGNYKTRMLLQVHDELIFDMHKDEAIVIKPLVENFMKTALPLSVPIEVGMGTGENWLDAH